MLGEDSTHVTLGLDVDRFEVSSDKKSKSWEQLNFNNTVAGAALVTLTRLKAETMNAEFDVVNRLYKQVSLGDFSFDEVAIISRPKSTYIIQGGTFETRFNVAAYDSKQGFKATIGGREYESADSGAIKYTTVCNTLGQQKITGTAYVQSPEGGIKEYPLSESYFVAKPIGVLMLDKMHFEAMRCIFKQGRRPAFRKNTTFHSVLSACCRLARFSFKNVLDDSYSFSRC